MPREYYVVVFIEKPTLQAMESKTDQIDVAIHASSSENQTFFYVRDKGTKALIKLIKSMATLYNEAIFNFEKNEDGLDIYSFNGYFNSLVEIFNKHRSKFLVNNDY